MAIEDGEFPNQPYGHHFGEEGRHLLEVVSASMCSVDSYCDN